jgi:predicted O-methyltransferase YrrM
MNQIDLRNITAEELFASTSAAENRDFVLRTLKRLTPDPIWSQKIVTDIEAGGVDVRCFVAWLARQLAPEAYLEVGVRRGFSMAMVAAQFPAIDLFASDLWVHNYAGAENLGPPFVTSEMAKLGYGKRIVFLNGDSHKLLPAFFGAPGSTIWSRIKVNSAARHRPKSFKLITIDGDHSLLGAYQDLIDTMPYCAVGGAVIFDDIVPDATSAADLAAVKEEWGPDPNGWQSLLGVWRAVQSEFPNFHYFEFTQHLPAVGIAIRVD